MSDPLREKLIKLAHARPELREDLLPILKQGAVDKVPIFSKFEVNLKPRDIEKMFLKHYPMARPGSLEIDRKVTKAMGGRMFSNLTMENDDPNAEDYERTLTGSLVVALDPDSSGARVYAFVNVDG